jgi:preprotein translocase subunit SecF
VFEVLSKTNIDFMSKGKITLGLSAIVFLACLGTLVTNGINYGIEFTGGTEMQVKFLEDPDLTAIRSELGDAMSAEGITGTPVVTTVGDPALREVSIRIGNTGADGDDQIATRMVVDSLRTAGDRDARAAGKINLNEDEVREIRDALVEAGVVTAEDADGFAEALRERRRERAILTGPADLDGVAGLTPEIRAFLDDSTYYGSFALRGQSYIGPAVGDELLSKAMWAILGSLGGVLVYIAFRFQIRWGVAAIIALVHDSVITLGLFSVFDQEMSLPVVASFLTLIGYSVNDTVVVFDRIRENLKAKAGQRMTDIVNVSINQTLSRTVITSGLTWVVVLGLWIFGGEALKAFSFVLVIGVLVGTYSSISVASPVLVLWRKASLKRKGVDADAADGRVARKVRAPGAKSS